MLALIYSFLSFLYEFVLAAYRDLSGAVLVVKAKRRVARFEKQNSTIFSEFQKLVRQQPNKACLICDGQVWTFKDKRFGLKKGDCVALFMDNRPEFVGIWLGLSKLGVISALVNTNLKNEPLLHSINVAKASIVIFSSNLEESLRTVLDKVDSNMLLVIDGDKPKSTNSLHLNDLLNQQILEIVEPNENINPNDTLVYIYTSGTTGLPKPAVIKQSRYYGGGNLFFEAAGLTKSDIVYDCLPIYHGNGGMLGVGAAIVSGATVVLRKKFSASQFWKECIEHECTAFVYVGEICRFLVNQPKSELDRAHKVSKAFGNGLRTNVWKEFSERFGVKCLEFYGASEGNCTIINNVYKLGACGFEPLINKYFPIFTIYLIRIDANMNPIRDEHGFCIRCQAGEKGLLVGLIGNDPMKAYNGYANNTQASRTKVIENVFRKGQCAFNSGDLMMMDTLGYFYFCDRLGDTYRWRGENVSTIEVENVISRNLDSREVVVYGVEVPGQEGKAGMAVINCRTDMVDLVGLGEKLKRDLPSYAKPVFIRFAQELEHTGTFKATKLKLIEESYNVKVISDQIYYFDLKENVYKRLSAEIYESILNGNIRL